MSTGKSKQPKTIPMQDLLPQNTDTVKAGSGVSPADAARAGAPPALSPAEAARAARPRLGRP